MILPLNRRPFFDTSDNRAGVLMPTSEMLAPNDWPATAAPWFQCCSILGQQHSHHDYPHERWKLRPTVQIRQRWLPRSCLNRCARSRNKAILVPHNAARDWQPEF